MEYAAGAALSMVLAPVIKSIFTDDPSPQVTQATAATADPPTITPPPVMPTPGDAPTQAAKRASLVEQARRRGRASTILTDQNADPLGG